MIIEKVMTLNREDLDEISKKKDVEDITLFDFTIPLSKIEEMSVIQFIDSYSSYTNILKNRWGDTGLV